MSDGAQLESYFLPADWILTHRPGQLVATKLGTGDVLTIGGSAADSLVQRRAHPSTWEALAKHEPLLGELHEQIGAHELAVLNRASLLRGAGWRQLFVELTARCNERCVHCYAESSPERTETLTWDEIRGVLDDARELGFEIVQLTGGDPLISPHCIRAAEYACKIGIPRLEVYTNGLALRGQTYERLRELGVAFAFSFYSHDPVRHDAITRTPGSHARTSRAIERAVQDGMTVRTGTVSMGENADDAEQTYDYLVRLGVNKSAIGIDAARTVGRGRAHAMLSAVPEHQVEREPERVLHRAPLESSESSEEAPGSRPFGGTAAVGPEGSVYPCIFSRHLSLGSIRAESLHSVLTAPDPVPTPTENLLAERSAWATRLSCWECQTRSHMLGARPSA